VARVRRLGPKVGSCLALFCIHRVNQVNSSNDAESCQHHKHCSVIIITILQRVELSADFGDVTALFQESDGKGGRQLAAHARAARASRTVHRRY